MRDTTRSFAKMAMTALITAETYKDSSKFDPVWIAKTAWRIAEEMEIEATRFDRESKSYSPEQVVCNNSSILCGHIGYPFGEPPALFCDLAKGHTGDHYSGNYNHSEIVENRRRAGLENKPNKKEE